MLHRFVQDMKSILRKPMLLLLLFFGLLIGSFAMLSVYTIHSSEKAVFNTGFAKDRIIQFDSYQIDGEAQRILSLVQEELPTVEYASVVSYDFENYDVVGLLNHRDTVDGNYYGDALTAEDMGRNVAMVSEDFVENLPENGGKISFGGRNFALKGTFYGGEAGYDAVSVDLRRLPEGTEYVAGMDFTLEREESISARENRVFMMPYDVFAELGYTPHTYVLFFAEPLTAEMRQEIQERLTAEVGVGAFLEMGDFDTVISKSQWSKSALYFAAVIAGLVNIVVLYAYLLEQNRKKYEIYRMLGAKNAVLLRMIFAELFFITAISYACGAALSAVWMANTDLIQTYLLPGFLEYLLIFLLIYAVEAVFTLGTVRKILGLRRERMPRAARRTSGKGGSKFLHLLGYQYSAKQLPGVISIVCLSFLVSTVFSYAMTYVFEETAYARYVKANTEKEVLTVHLSFDHYDEVFYQFLETETHYSRTQTHQDLLERLHAVENTTIGIQHEGIYARDSRAYIDTFNREYLEAIHFPLRRGGDALLLEYDPADESAPIPCLISEGLAKEHPLGSTFTETVVFETGAHVVSAEDAQIEYGTEELTRTFYVAGIYENGAMKTDTGGYFQATSVDITQCYTDMEDAIIAPEFYHEGKGAYSVEEPTYFLFCEKGDGAAETAAKEIFAGLGEIHSFRECLQTYAETYQKGGGALYFAYAVIAALLLLLGSGAFLVMQQAGNLRTFGVYFTCGMPWKTALGISVGAIALNMMPSSILGGVAGALLSEGIRAGFSEGTLLLSVVTGIGFAAVLAIIVMIVNLFLLKGKSPRQIFGEERE